MSTMIQVISRYGLVSAGPVAAAIVQFVLSLFLLRNVSLTEFGAFAFLLLLTQFMQGVWGALFCAPLIVAYAQPDEHDMVADTTAITSVGGLAAMAATMALSAIAMMIGIGVLPALVYGAFGGLSLVRTLARGHMFAVGKATNTAVSDFIYAMTTGLGIAVLALVQRVSVDGAFLVLGVAVVAGICVVAPSILFAQFKWRDWNFAARYGQVWRKHASWSLVGVVTTEITANSHAYLVGALLGPKAFAPIAATALFIRPIGVGMNAVMEYERAQMARSLGVSDFAAVRTAKRHMLQLLSLSWVATAIVAMFVLRLYPGLLFPDGYMIDVLYIGTALWLGVAVARVLRAGDSAVLQASGQFRSLAFASLYACGFSISGVAVTILIAPPIWSISGTVIGEAVFALWTRRAAKKLPALIDAK